MNKTADTILDKLWCAGWNKAKQPGIETGTLIEAKQSLMNDILALVGEDWPGDEYDAAIVNTLKNDLREKLRHYFGQDNQGGKT